MTSTPSSQAVHPCFDPERMRRAAVLITGIGNIGSPLAVLLAQAGVGCIRLVDRDRVEPKNLANQAFQPADVGSPKAAVLARRLQSQFPGLTIEEIVADLEDLPLGTFQGEVILGALDSRRARQALISEIAWPLGIPVVDGGVGEGLIGRVQVFVPAPETACLECTWGQEDYRQLTAEYPCHPEQPAAAPPTVSPAFSGTVVAGFMAAECLRLLSSQAPSESREIAFDLWHRRLLASRLRQAPRCRFDHQVVQEVIPLDKDYSSVTARDVLTAIAKNFGSSRVHLECRRGLLHGAFGRQRYVPLERLHHDAGTLLANIGFRANDRIRVRAADRSAYLVWDHPTTRDSHASA